MFPKRSSEFAVFFILCPISFDSLSFFLFSDWSILLGRVDNPMRDDFWPRRFEERVNILFNYVIAG